jgi:RNA polymerase sigma-70 factor (ECF subfamily)
MRMEPDLPPTPDPSGRGDPSRLATRLVELLARSSRGDEQAFAEIYDLTTARVFGLARRVVRDPAQAEEVAQEAFLEIWHQSARFDPDRGSALAWMLTIVHRRSVDRVRAAESSHERDRRYAALGDGPEYDVVDEAVTASFEQARVRRALGTLTDVQREAVTLAYYGGYTHREVSDLLGVPLGTVKTRMRDGLIRLRDTLGVEA